MFKNKKGFTLIEFIIVMAIIGILVLMASPKFLSYVEKAKETQIKNDIKVLHTIIQAEIADKQITGEKVDFIGEKETAHKGIVYSFEGKNKKSLGNDLEEVQKINTTNDFLQKNFNSKLKDKENFIFYYDEKNNEVYAVDTTNAEPPKETPEG